MPVPRTDSALSRPSLALANLIYGDIGAAGRSLVSPESLSPSEARDMADRLGLDKGPFRTIFNTITNPLVILGVMAAMHYRVPTLANLTKFSAQVKKAAGRAPLLQGLKGIQNIFKDKMDEVVEPYFGALRNLKEFREKYLSRALQITEDYQKRTGKVFDAKDQFAIFARLGKMDVDDVLAYRRIDGEELQIINPVNRKAITDYFERNEPLQRVAKDFRTLYNDIYGDIVGQAGAEETLKEAVLQAGRKQVKRLSRQGVAQIERKLASRGFILPGEFVENYVPKMLPSNYLSAEEWRRFALAASAGAQKLYGQQGVQRAAEAISARFFKRLGKMLPSYDELKFVQKRAPEFFDDTALEGLKDAIAKGGSIQVGAGAFLKEVPIVHSVDFMNTFERYVNSLATTYAWTVKGAGPKLRTAVDDLLAKGDIKRARILQDTYIPIATGRLNYRQQEAAQVWANRIQKSHEWLKGMEKYVPKPLYNWLDNALEKERGPFSISNVSGGVANWLYLSTLGGNVGSATLNLLQTAITTFPTIGAEATFEGMRRTWQGAQKYYKYRTQGLIHERALEKAFPAFAETGLVASPITDEIIHGAFKNAFDASAMAVQHPGLYKTMDQSKRFLMSLFTGSETFNRLVAFEGAMWKGAKEGMKGARLLQQSRNVVGMTQFMSGPETTPAWVLTMNPLVRQYMMFPMKMLEFTLDTATSLGSGAQAGFLGRNWGTLGRSLAASGAMYEVGREMGADLSEGLLTGTLPVPRSDSPFGIIPFVPPVFSAAGNLFRSVYEGETQHARKVLPMMVPGGTAAARAAGFLPGVGTPAREGASGVLGRFYADYEHPTPDGRYPVLSSKGSLVGYETPFQIALRGMGVPGGGNEIRQESAAMGWVLKNRDRIRAYRRDYLNAILNNDPSKAIKIREEYERTYKMALVVKKQDIKAAQLRRNVTRLERVLETLPPELRPQFAAVLQTAIFQDGSNFLGVDPQLLGHGTVTQRNPYRVGTAGGTRTSASQMGSGMRQPGRAPQGTAQPGMPFPGRVRTPLTTPLIQGPLSQGFRNGGRVYV